MENSHPLTTQIRFELTKNRLGNQSFSWSATTGFSWSISPDFPVRAQAHYIFSLAKVFMNRFGKSPVVIKKDIILSFSGPIKLEGVGYDFVKKKRQPVKKKIKF